MAKPLPPSEHKDVSTLGDHPALDFLNTVVRIDGELVDTLQNDGDVLRWLAQAGWPVQEQETVNLQPSSLLDMARSFREIIRAAIERRTAEKQNVAVLNAILAEALSHPKLVPDIDGGLRLERQWRQDSLAQMIAPVVEAAAVLLATGDLSRIKKCENEECVLWFYDRTRSHHRRWCNMATCGTRHKVAAFRKRRQSGSA